MIGTKASRSRTRPTRIRTCRLGSQLPWEVEWLEDRLLLALTFPSTPNVTLSLDLTGADQNLASGSNLAIGEIGIETLKVGVPRGTIPNAQLTVSLPQGLALVSLDSVTASPGVSASAGSFASILSGATIGLQDSSATLDFGTISNSNDPITDEPTDYITLVYDVVALNVAANQNGAVASSTATLNFAGGSATASVPATIVTPDLNVAMSVNNPYPQPNDTVTFTLVLTHSPDSAAGGYTVNLTDALPSGVTYVADSLQAVSGQAPEHLSYAGGTIQALYDSFPLNATSTLRFQARITPTVANPVSGTNTAHVTYTTLPGPGDPHLPPTDISAYERTGNPADPGGALNNLATSASASYTITQITQLGIFESIVGPGGPFLESANVAVGTRVQYRVYISLPQGFTLEGVFTDLLNPGLALLSLDDITADPDLSSSRPGGFAAALDAARSTVDTGGGRFVIDFGPISNAGNDRAGIALTFTAVVLNTAGNQRGTALSNGAFYSDTRGTVGTFAATVHVQSPNLAVTETRSAATGDAGGTPITFTIVVAHTSSSTADAFDLALTDAIPSGFTLVPDSLRSTAGTAPDALVVSGNVITATYQSLALGNTSTLTFQATLNSAVAPGEIKRNTVNLAYSTQPGDVTDPQSPYNVLSTERTGDPADPGGPVNNLNASATASVTVSGSTLSGSVYVDADNDGLLEQGEIGLGGVPITLAGVDLLGNPVSAVTTTENTGAYRFSGLRAGTYSITVSEPASYVPGKDQIGSKGGQNPTVDQFTRIVLGSGSSGTGYNFGERATSALALGATIDDSSPNVGQQVTYTLTLANFGPNNASAVAIQAGLPAGLNFVSATASAGLYESTTGVWVVPTLAKGATTTLSITATVNSPALQTLIAAITAAGQADPSSLDNTASVDERPQASALVLTTEFDHAAPNLGDTIQYVVTLTNNGPDDATGVVFTALLPPGLVFVSSLYNAGSYNPDTGVWTVGAIASGASVGLTVAAQVASSAPQTIVATANADQFDPAPSGATSSVTATPQIADLALTSSISSATPNVGQSITGDVTLTDNGPAAASGIVVTVPLPKGLTFQSAVPTVGTYDISTGEWRIGSLAKGASATLSFVATVVSAAPQSINAAVVNADQFDPAAANNTSKLLASPQQAELKVIETISDPHPNLGDTIKFTTTLVNGGPDAATNVVLRSLLPASLVLISALPSQGSYDPETGLWSVGSVPSTGTLTLVLSARVGSPIPAAFTTSVLASDQFDPVDVNNDSTTGEAIQIANLSLIGTVSDETPDVGEAVTYTVFVSNRGPDSATNVTARVPLPAGLTFFSAIPSQGSYDPLTGIWTIGSVSLDAVPSLTLTAQVATDSTQITIAAISTVDQFVPNTLGTTQSVVVTPQAAVALALPAIEASLPFVPVIGTLITGSTTATSSSGSDTGAGSDNANSDTGATGGSRGDSRPSPASHGTKSAHTPSHAHPSHHHANPHAGGPAAPFIVIIPDNALAMHAVPAPPGAGGAQHNGAGPGGAQVMGGLPAQALAARAAGVSFSGSPTPMVDLNAPFAAAADTGAVGTTMKVVTFIQVQRIWSRGSKAHQHGARRRFR